MTKKLSIKLKNFDRGLITSIESHSIPKEASSNVLNFLTKGDRVELRRGMLLLGAEITGVGKITGLHKAIRVDGIEVLFRTRGKKIEYYNTTTEDWVEAGSDELGTAGDGKQISFADYNTNAGSQLFVNSPKIELRKIMVANPASITNLYNASKNYKGYIKIKQNRMFLFNRVEDNSGIYCSYIDALNSTAVSAEVAGTGDDIEKTFNHTLVFKAGGAKRTCFGIVATDGVETFTDDYNGVLTGDKGGSGTINYTTGAISLTFNTAVANAVNITVDYQWEDSTNNGIADFTYSSTRLAGEGSVFRQDDGGGEVRDVLSYGDTEFCIHEKKTWALTLTNDDTNASNNIYRNRVGLSSLLGAVESGDGIYYVDNNDLDEPKIKLLTLDAGSSEVIPITISENLDLSDYRFNKMKSIEFGDFILWACRESDSDENNRVIFYNKKWKSFDILDYFVNEFIVYNGALYCGDSISNNVYELLSGLDDDDSNIEGVYETANFNFGYEGLKKCKNLIISGRIGTEQQTKIYASIDRGSYVEIGTIDGSGSYVDTGQSVNVGAVVVGKIEVGGGGSGIIAHNYIRKIKLSLDKFSLIKLKFETQNLGWFDFSDIEFDDIRLKRKKIPTAYR